MDYPNELRKDLNTDLLTEKDAGNSYLLSLEGALEVEIENLTPGVYFRSTISPCPKTKKETLFIYLMKANLFNQGTLGATIGVSPDEKIITLSRALPFDMNYTLFKQALEDFANTADYWKREIKKLHKTQRGIA